MAILDRAKGEVAFQKAKRNLKQEARDVHDIDAQLLGEEKAEENRRLLAVASSAIPGGGQKLKAVKGMGTIYDWRGTGWAPANGGKINPLIFVQHIPVVPNKDGIGDFITLRNVLVAQGLMVQTATDREGNVALYTPFDVLCYQARGANQFSCGCEHMHMSISEPWSKKQLRASAWLAQLARRKHNIPVQMADLDPGPGVVKVKRRGHTSHKNVSAKAGYNDRSDPGPGYDWEYVSHCVNFFEDHGHFEGA